MEIKPERMFTPRQLSEETGHTVTSDTILAFIHSGELVAQNVARPGALKPRWVIAESAWAKFLKQRSNGLAEQAKPCRPRRSQPMRRTYV